MMTDRTVDRLSPALRIVAAALVVISMGFVVGRSLVPQASGASTRSTAVADTVPAGLETATIAGGCFWAMEERFKMLKGVVSAVPGYSGGKSASPSYEEVCAGTTGHAESVQIVFDPKVISYHDLLDIFMHVHDPTTPNRQGNDSGTQYRSAIFFRNAQQKATAEKVIGEIRTARVWPGAIVTQLTPYTKFYRAEDYHIDYCPNHADNGYCQNVVNPEVDHFKSMYKDWLK
ncbi:MAG TPA: peptide-methionine (S)-S-oxide reductase MsrA [Capsulimonadaceae bacterium]|jgi:methionine-S-sulfoxide reductase